MPSKQLKDLLDKRGVKYVTIAHSTAYTAQETASEAHIHGDEFAKTVIVTVDGKMVMAVLPASHQVDLARFKAAAGGATVELASEKDFRRKFPECDAGAEPPLGQLYGIPVFVDETLTRDKEIAFNAGTHHELIRMSYEDFARLAQPTVARFSVSGEVVLRL